MQFSIQNYVVNILIWHSDVKCDSAKKDYNNWKNKNWNENCTVADKQ